MIKSFGSEVSFNRDWWLRNLFDNFGSFKVCYKSKDFYSRWVDYRSGVMFDKLNVEREVLFNELCFDFDNLDYSKDVISSKLLTKKFDSSTIPYYLFYSGNKGIHSSTFIDIPYLKLNFEKEIVDSMKYGITLKDVKKYYFDRFLSDLYGDSFIDRMLVNSKTHMVRCVGSIHPKSGYYKTFIGRSGADILYSKPIVEPPNMPSFPSEATHYFNKISLWMPKDFKEVSMELINNVKAGNVKFVDASKQISLRRFYFGESSRVDKEKELLNVKLKDGRQRYAVFVLIPYLVSKKYSLGSVKEKVKQWCNLNQYSTPIKVDYLYRYCKEKGRHVSWGWYKELKKFAVGALVDKGEAKS